MPSNRASGVGAIILAAGRGTRMKSELPKVLHPVAGIPMLAHVVAAAAKAGANPISVVVSPENAGDIEEALSAIEHKVELRFAVQKKQLGTGDAARVGLAALPSSIKHLYLINGDTPLLEPTTLKSLAKLNAKSEVAVLSAVLDDPFGYGRIVREKRGGRDGSKATAIIEEKDASLAQREIGEINVGTYFCTRRHLESTIDKMRTNNRQNEFYLTDLVSQAEKGAAVLALSDPQEGMGINTRVQLAEVEAVYRARTAYAMIEKGVQLDDPDGTFVDALVQVSAGAHLGVGVQLRGRTKIAKNAFIEGPSVLVDSTVQEGAKVHAFSHLEEAHVGRDASVGPFARLRPGARLESEAKVGNFVEMKKARLAKGSKVNHLSYIGDAEIGPGSNIGAGTITCNYDGFAKHQTKIGADVFVGSNSTLVAPLRLGKGTFVAAGSTITQHTPSDSLAIGRSRQDNKKGYASRLRARLAKAKKNEG